MKLVLATFFFVLTTALPLRRIIRDAFEPKLYEIKDTTTYALLSDFDVYHNVIRQMHGIGPLDMTRRLLDYARTRAILYAWYNGTVPETGGNVTFGENVYVANGVASVEEIMEAWYFNESKDYDYNDPKLSPETKDFTQIIWKDTQYFCCGQAMIFDEPQRSFTVCYYEKPGNIAGQEKDNINPIVEEGKIEEIITSLEVIKS